MASEIRPKSPKFDNCSTASSVSDEVLRIVKAERALCQTFTSRSSSHNEDISV